MGTRSKMIHEFNKSLEAGKKGEEIFKKWLEEYFCQGPPDMWLTDVRDKEIYQKQDIDFFVGWGHHQDDCWAIDLKTDSWMSKTGNVFIETISNKEYMNLGWLHKSQADYIYYLDINTGKLYKFTMEYLRRWFECNRDKYQKKVIQNPKYTSEGFLVPLSEAPCELVATLEV